MIAFVNPATVLTSATLAAGFAAVMLAAAGSLEAAAAAVAAAAVLDAADGFVARRLSILGRFGSHLDSLADVVAFGVAPALMLQRQVLDTLPVVGTATCLAFVVAGACRLARFQLVEDPRRFVGLPIPPAGLAVALAAAADVASALALALTLVLAGLMVSSIPFPTLDTLARRVRREADAVGADKPDAARRPATAGADEAVVAPPSRSRRRRVRRRVRVPRPLRRARR